MATILSEETKAEMLEHLKVNLSLINSILENIDELKYQIAEEKIRLESESITEIKTAKLLSDTQREGIRPDKNAALKITVVKLQNIHEKLMHQLHDAQSRINNTKEQIANMAKKEAEVKRIQARTKMFLDRIPADCIKLLEERTVLAKKKREKEIMAMDLLDNDEVGDTDDDDANESSIPITNPDEEKLLLIAQEQKECKQKKKNIIEDLNYKIAILKARLEKKNKKMLIQQTTVAEMPVSELLGQNRYSLLDDTCRVSAPQVVAKTPKPVVVKPKVVAQENPKPVARVVDLNYVLKYKKLCDMIVSEDLSKVVSETKEPNHLAILESMFARVNHVVSRKGLTKLIEILLTKCANHEYLVSSLPCIQPSKHSLWNDGKVIDYQESREENLPICHACCDKQPCIYAEAHALHGTNVRKFEGRPKRQMCPEWLLGEPCTNKTHSVRGDGAHLWLLFGLLRGLYPDQKTGHIKHAGVEYIVKPSISIKAKEGMKYFNLSGSAEGVDNRRPYFTIMSKLIIEAILKIYGKIADDTTSRSQQPLGRQIGGIVKFDRYALLFVPMFVTTGIDASAKQATWSGIAARTTTKAQAPTIKLDSKEFPDLKEAKDRKVSNTSDSPANIMIRAWFPNSKLPSDGKEVLRIMAQHHGCLCPFQLENKECIGNVCRNRLHPNGDVLDAIMNAIEVANTARRNNPYYNKYQGTICMSCIVDGICTEPICRTFHPRRGDVNMDLRATGLYSFLFPKPRSHYSPTPFHRH